MMNDIDIDIQTYSTGPAIPSAPRWQSIRMHHRPSGFTVYAEGQRATMQLRDEAKQKLREFVEPWELDRKVTAFRTAYHNETTVLLPRIAVKRALKQIL